MELFTHPVSAMKRVFNNCTLTTAVAAMRLHCTACLLLVLLILLLLGMHSIAAADLSVSSHHPTSALASPGLTSPTAVAAAAAAAAAAGSTA
jgi:hypothetical protein